jgi:hypothetical protein
MRMTETVQKSAAPTEREIVEAQRGAVDAMLNALKGTPCPNCHDPLPASPALTPTGVVVCDQSCLEGWMNGEECKNTLTLIREIRALIAA